MEKEIKVTTDKRDSLFDNIKGFLIILVLVGHIIEYVAVRSESIFLKTIYSGIYVFHMPLFIFISGYFSKKNNTKKLVELGIVYVIWQSIIFPLFESINKGISFNKANQSVFVPEFGFWFILSLITWKVIVPYVKEVRFNFLISIILGLAVGFPQLDINIRYFSLGRTIAFLPFFLLGYYCTYEKFYEIRKKVRRRFPIIIVTIGSITLGIVMIFITKKLCIKPLDIYKSLYMSYSYAEYLKNPVWGIFIRFILYVIQFICIYGISVLFTAKRIVLSNIGKNTLFIYFSHIIFLKIFDVHYVKTLVNSNQYLYIICSVAVSIVYCIIFSNEKISRITNKLVSVPKWVLKNEIK